VVGGAGLAYGGLKVGRAAEHLRRAADAGTTAAHAATHAAHQVGTAAEHTAAVAGAVRKTGRVVTAPFRWTRWVLGFGVAGSVSADRYKKKLHEDDVERASTHYVRSAVAGAGLGLGLRKGALSRRGAAGLGAAGGLAAQGLTRAATGATKDRFGDRSPGAKVVDRIPGRVLQGAAVMAGYRKLRGKARGLGGGVKRAVSAAPRAALDTVRSAIGFATAPAPGQSNVGRIVRVLRKKPVLTGAALAGGIAAADTVAAISDRQPGQSTAQAAAHGVKKGLLYGTVLAGTEPVLHRGLVGLLRRRKVSSFHAFGGRQQLRDAGNRFLDPLAVASGSRTAYHRDESGVSHAVDLPVGHAQVVRAAYRQGKVLHTVGSRTGGLLKDAADAAAGRAKVDARGRPQKREWEKSWFKRAAGAAIVGAGLLGHAAVMRKSPKYRAKVQRGMRTVQSQVNRVVPDTFPTHSFDVSAPDWDVRDQRGRSARVFAPGARPRERREKNWWEKVGNIRKAAVAGAVASAAGGALLGWKLRGRGLKAKVPKPAAPRVIVPFMPAGRG
jgi:hypothetical protein